MLTLLWVGLYYHNGARVGEGEREREKVRERMTSQRLRRLPNYPFLNRRVAPTLPLARRATFFPFASAQLCVPVLVLGATGFGVTTRLKYGSASPVGNLIFDSSATRTAPRHT